MYQAILQEAKTHQNLQRKAVDRTREWYRINTNLSLAKRKKETILKQRVDLHLRNQGPEAGTEKQHATEEQRLTDEESKVDRELASHSVAESEAEGRKEEAKHAAAETEESGAALFKKYAQVTRAGGRATSGASVEVPASHQEGMLLAQVTKLKGSEESLKEQVRLLEKAKKLADRQAAKGK